MQTMLLEINFKITEYGSPEYKKAVVLRERILRKPLGLSFSESELFAEKEHIQIIGLNGLELIATAVLVPKGQNCKMQRVVVKEDLTNNGIGSRMMIFCEDVAKKNGFKKLYCHTRATAVEFYFKNGYEAQGDYFEEDFIPHLKMNKVL